MCLSVPCKVISIDGDNATVSIGGNLCQISLQLVDNVSVGDYVLLHAGFAIQKINENEAKEMLSVLDELCEVNQRNIPEESN